MNLVNSELSLMLLASGSQTYKIIGKLLLISMFIAGVSLTGPPAMASDKAVHSDEPSGALPFGECVRQVPKIDTIFADQILPKTTLLTDIHNRYTMLIYANHTFKSIKLLDEQVKLNGDQVTVAQKLYDGSSFNTDSVIVNRQTLMPIESYSTLPTSKDSFTYKANKITGTMTTIIGNQKSSILIIDTLFSKPMFNGLTYAETYQSLSYKMRIPFYIADYVPGHRVNYERVEYIKDEELIVDGIKISAMVLEIKKTDKITIHCWLSTKCQEILKMEGEFPGFSYELLKL